MVDVKKGNNMFLINAPAGSGKTTYIENTIMDLLAQYPNRKILAITYTNRAKEELKSRIDSKNVTVDTIHSFLSSFVGLYLSKIEVIELYFHVFGNVIVSMINKGETDEKNIRYINKFGKLNYETVKENIKRVYYNEQAYSSYYYGGLSHDDLLYFCRKMFEAFPILQKRLSNKYSYIFIDEYQDTSADVLYIFYESILNTNSKLYLLGDKMQEIYDNYDGSFNKILSTFNSDTSLNINYRCSSDIVRVLNNIYNDPKFNQEPNRSDQKSKPAIIITNDFSEPFMSQFEDFMQLYVFNRKRFEKIGVIDLYNSLSGMKAYRFPSKYTPTDVLADKTNDNPDKLFRILFCICDFIKLTNIGAFGRSLRLAKEKNQIFNKKLTKIEFHSDKLAFSEKINKLNREYNSSQTSIKDFCEFLVDNEFCNTDTFSSIIADEEYMDVLNVPLAQLNILYTYLENPGISTQHGVKGEGHTKVCFVAEDSTKTPRVHMYDFFRLFCNEDINLTDFQNFYYDYVSELKKVDLTFLSPAQTYKLYKDKYIQMAQDIKKKNEDNKYFSFCELDVYDKYINHPTSSNAKQCFKITRIKGILWAYKLFYVGCSRAKEDLVVLVDENKISSYKDVFKRKMTSIGFDVR